MTDKLFRRGLLWLLLTAGVLICISRYSTIDLQLSDWMYDRTRQEFPWRESWFSAVFMHQWAKYAFIGIGIIACAVLLGVAVLRPRWGDRAFRRRLMVVVASYVSVPTAISIMKSRSIHHCPWDLSRYGGFASYLRLFDHLPAGMKAGHCFPAGHASSALWLAAFAVFWLPKRPRIAAVVFVLGLSPGLLMGWIQQMRGAHFLTHTLWSAWIASLLILLIARCLFAEQ